MFILIYNKSMEKKVEKQNIYELALKKEHELSSEELKSVQEFKHGLYDKLIEILEGETIAERELQIETMSFEQMVRKVEEHENSNNS